VNLYLEASAAVKRYLVETGTPEVVAGIAAATQVATSQVSRVEVTATLARAARGGRITHAEAVLVRNAFEADWGCFVQIPTSRSVISQGVQSAWDYGLRGYDAVHLASALTWQVVLGAPVTVATFDRELWKACAPAGLLTWPPGTVFFGAVP